MPTPAELLARHTGQAEISSFYIDKIGQIWVSAYGAVGDGVTDDTLAAQTAVGVAKAAGTNEVYFVSGKTYKITSLTDTEGITFYGNNVTVTGGATINFASIAGLHNEVTLHKAEYAAFKAGVEKAFVNIKAPPAPLTTAKGGGVVFDTAAIQACIDYCNVNGGGVVLCPPDKYKITSLDLKVGVALLGASFFDNGFENGVDYSAKKGTWFYCVDTSSPAILMSEGCSIENISFYYPEQVMTGTPTEYPPSIQTKSSHIRMTVKNCFFANSYIAVRAITAHELLNISNCYGFPLYIGLDLSGASDSNRISNIHFNRNQFWECDDTQKAWVNANGYAYKIGRLDAPFISNLFAFGYKYGIYVGDDATYGYSGSLHFIECAFDTCRYPFYLEGNAIDTKIIGGGGISGDFADPSVIASAITVNLTNDITISDATVGQAGLNGIHVIAANNIAIRNNNIKHYAKNTSVGVTAAAITIIDGDDIDISHNYIDGIKADGQETEYAYGISIGTSSNRIKIKDNTIKNCGLTTDKKFAVILGAGSNHIICKDNIFVNTGNIFDNTGEVTKDIGSNMNI